jgi:hypothetical protein
MTGESETAAQGTRICGCLRANISYWGIGKHPRNGLLVRYETVSAV